MGDKEQKQREKIKEAAEKIGGDDIGKREEFIEKYHPNLKEEHKQKIKETWKK